KKPWQRSCLSSKLKSSSAPIGREDSWCFHAVGSSNAPLLGSTAAEGLPRIGRTSIATHWRSCGLPQSASCSENFVTPPELFGQATRGQRSRGRIRTAADNLSYQVLGHLGRRFTRLVLQGYNDNRLTLSATSGYLGVQAKWVPTIERATFGALA